MQAATTSEPSARRHRAPAWLKASLVALALVGLVGYSAVTNGVGGLVGNAFSDGGRVEEEEEAAKLLAADPSACACATDCTSTFVLGPKCDIPAWKPVLCFLLILYMFLGTS